MQHYISSMKCFIVHYFCGKERDGFQKAIKCVPITPQYDCIYVDIRVCVFSPKIWVSKLSHMLVRFTAYLKRKRFSHFWICKKGVSFSRWLYIYIELENNGGKTRERRRRSLMYSRYPLCIIYSNAVSNAKIIWRSQKPVLFLLKRAETCEQRKFSNSEWNIYGSKFWFKLE